MESDYPRVPQCMIVGNSPMIYSAPLTREKAYQLDHPRRHEAVEGRERLDLTGNILLGGSLVTGIAGMLGAAGCAIKESITDKPDTTFSVVVWGTYALCAVMTGLGIWYSNRKGNSK